MLRAAIAAGTSRECTQQVDLGEKFDEIVGAHRTCLHEILMLVMGETSAHEYVEHIMHMCFGLMQRQLDSKGQGAGQV